MIYDFALEPELVASWGNLQDYRYFAQAFGLGQPRIMAEYPKLKNWRRQVLQAAQGAGDLEFERVTALIGIFTECVVSRDRQYEGALGWLPNAEQEHARIPFHAILANSNPHRHPVVLTEHNLGVDQDRRWELGRSATPNRKAGDLADSVASMLRICNVVIFVDPHFGPENSRHRKPLGAFLDKILARGPECPMPKRIEMQTSDKADEMYFRSECDKHLAIIIPQGLSLRIVRWRERDGGEKLHGRYILTDVGGVSFQIGLDEGKTGETEDIDLMDRAKYLKRWSQYASNEPAFDRSGEPIEIVGIAPLSSVPGSNPYSCCRSSKSVSF